MAAEQKQLFNIQITLPSGEKFEKRFYAETPWAAIEKALTEHRGEQPDRKQYKHLKKTYRRNQ